MASMVKKPTKKTSKYQVILKVNEKEFKSPGATLSEAMKKFDWDFFKKNLFLILKTRSVLTVKHGKRTNEMLLSAYQTRRFFASPIMKEIIAKRFSPVL